MVKELRRQDITFETKDQPLRDDVRILGTLVGDLLRDQGGPELFELVENARLRSIRRRENNERPGEELAELVGDLDLSLAMEVIRAFSTYFQMVNTAEKVHRIRRRREYLQEYGQFQPGGLEETLVKLKAAGLAVEEVKSLFSGLRIGATLAVIGVVVGELVGGNVGLGYLLIFGEGAGNTAMVFVAIIMLTAIGILAYVSVVLLEGRVLHYLPRDAVRAT